MKSLLSCFCLLLLCTPLFPARRDFSWVEKKENPELWTTIESAFKEELKPGTTIYKIGQFNYACLVIVAREAGFGSTPKAMNFEAYNYDLYHQKKSNISTVGMDWHYIGRALFERSTIPDITYSHADCYECESSQYLSSLRYFHETNSWTLRSWKDGVTNILIGSENGYGDGSNYSFHALFKVADITKDGYEDVLVRNCWFLKGEENKEDKTFLWSIEKGNGGALEITDKLELNRLHVLLCADENEDELCKSGSGG